MATINGMNLPSPFVIASAEASAHFGERDMFRSSKRAVRQLGRARCQMLHKADSPMPHDQIDDLGWKSEE